MKSGVLLLIISYVFAHNDEKLLSPKPLSRMKRGAVGALHIVTNHAQPIHADVKPEAANDNTEKGPTEQKLHISDDDDCLKDVYGSTVFDNLQPCPKGSGPSHIEPGVGFKVTPPESDVVTYEMKSLRKSLAYAPPTTLTLIRSISRVATLLVLFASAVLEFYPTFHHLMCTIFSFMNA